MQLLQKKNMKELFLLLIGHAFADFGLQTEWIANNKNRHNIPKGYNPKLHGKLQTIWPYVLSSHALIHAGFVYLITGNIIYAYMEFIFHWIIDFGKCEKWYGIHTDQALHILTKLFYLL